MLGGEGLQRGQDGGPHSFLVTSLLATFSEDLAAYICAGYIQGPEGFSLEDRARVRGVISLLPKEGLRVICCLFGLHSEA